jgi:hypothetical protein
MGTAENYQAAVLGTTCLTFSRPLQDVSSLCSWFPGLRPGLLSAVPPGLASSHIRPEGPLKPSYLSGVSIGATGGAIGSFVPGIGCLAAPPERRAAMRRDRNRSAICLGTSADLIKLIWAPWVCRYLRKVARLEQELRLKARKQNALLLVYSVTVFPRPGWLADHPERHRPRSWSGHRWRRCTPRKKPR